MSENPYTEYVKSLELEIERLKKEKSEMDELIRSQFDTISQYLEADKAQVSVIMGLCTEKDNLKEENNKLKEEKDLIIDKYVGLDFANEQLREEIERLKSSSEVVKELLKQMRLQLNYLCYDGNLLEKAGKLWGIFFELEKQFPDLAVEEKKEDTCICKNCITENMHTCYNCGKTL